MNNISEKNKNLINALLTVIKEKYGSDVDLFGVYGSVAQGVADDYSNVDILVVMRDGCDAVINTSFIFSLDLLEIGYSVKSLTWRELSALSGTIDEGVILQLIPLYNRDYSAIERFLHIKREAESSVILPLNDKKLQAIIPLITALKVANSDAQTSTKEKVKYFVVKLLTIACEVLTALNSGYIRYSLIERKKDVEMLSILPEKFVEYYNLILEKNDEKDLKNYANEITRQVCQIFDKLSAIHVKKDFKSFEGSYEKFFATVNSKFVKSQVYADRKITSLVGYSLLNSVLQIESETGVKVPLSFEDAFNSNKLPMLLKQVKDFFEKEYLAKNIKVKKFVSIEQIATDLFN